MNPRKNPFSRADNPPSLKLRRVKIAFIGAGKMAEAVISGLLKSKSISSSQIIVSDIKKGRLDYLKNAYKVVPASTSQKAVNSSTVVVLSVKPQNFPEVLENTDFSHAKLVISIAAGITLRYLETKILGKSIIRVMPNNPALVQEGISVLTAGKNVKREDIDAAKSIFKAVGDVVEVDESVMDAVTGLSGSGPAFVYLFVEAMIEAGESLGLTKPEAERLALYTLLGSAQTIIKTKRSPRELIEMVASPGGTTKAGLNVLETKGFKRIVIDAIIAAANKSKELS